MEAGLVQWPAAPGQGLVRRSARSAAYGKVWQDLQVHSHSLLRNNCERAQLAATPPGRSPLEGKNIITRRQRETVMPFLVRYDLGDLLLAALPQNNQRIFRKVYRYRFRLTAVFKFGPSPGGGDLEVSFEKTGRNSGRARTLARGQANLADYHEDNETPDHKPGQTRRKSAETRMRGAATALVLRSPEKQTAPAESRWSCR